MALDNVVPFLNPRGECSLCPHPLGVLLVSPTARSPASYHGLLAIPTWCLHFILPWVLTPFQLIYASRADLSSEASEEIQNRPLMQPVLTEALTILMHGVQWHSHHTEHVRSPYFLKLLWLTI